MGKFRKAILEALSRVPQGHWQRIDGLRCEHGVIERDWWFFNFRLKLMERAGLIKSKRFGSFWPSLAELPYYAITDKGSAALAED